MIAAAVLLLLPLALLAMFSAAEMAIVGADRSQLRGRAAGGDRGPRRALRHAPAAVAARPAADYDSRGAP